MSDSNRNTKGAWLAAILGGIVAGLAKNAAERASSKRPLSVGDPRSQQLSDRSQVVDSTIIDFDYDEIDKKHGA